jgi:integrase
MRGDGGLYERPGSPYWWARYYGPDGREIRKSTKARKEERSRAERILERLVREVKNYRDGITPDYANPRKGKKRFRELADALAFDAKVRKLASAIAVRSHLNNASRILGGKMSRSIDADTLRRYQKQRQEEGAASKTIDHEVFQVRQALKLAGLPAPKVPRLLHGIENARQGFLTDREREAILEELKKLNTNLYDFIDWSLETGARIGETDSLRWSDVDRETGTISLPPLGAKTGKARKFPIVERLIPIIERRRAARRLDGDYIFHNEGRRFCKRDANGHPHGFNDWIYKTWREACENANVDGQPVRMVDQDGERRLPLPHDLRRTAVRNMVRSGIDRTVAKKISGHATDSMFERYNITDEADIREAFAKMALRAQTVDRQRRMN